MTSSYNCYSKEQKALCYQCYHFTIFIRDIRTPGAFLQLAIMKPIFFGVVLLVALSSGQMTNPITDGVKELILAVITGVMEEIKKAIKEACDRNGGSFDNLTSAWSEANDFQNGHFKEFERDVKEAKRVGNLSAVFKNYCNLSEGLINHVHELSDAAMKCSELGTRLTIEHVRNILEKGIKFACENHGKRIALFLAEDGIECVISKDKALMECGAGGQVAFGDLNALQNFNFTKGVCQDYTKMQECMVKTLGECEKTAPAKVSEEFLKELYSSSPCLDLAEFNF